MTEKDCIGTAELVYLLEVRGWAATLRDRSAGERALLAACLCDTIDLLRRVGANNLRRQMARTVRLLVARLERE